MTQKNWSPDSWMQRPAQQQPVYGDPALCAAVLERIAQYPPLVSVGEVEKLRRELAQAGRGEAFVLHGGNCAERFIDCHPQVIVNKLKILLQMSVILAYGVRKPVIRLGRMAGQYAKPRTSDTEMVDGVELPSYRGDIVNGVEPDAAVRQPDPTRLESSYFHAAATLNHIRSLIDGGFADLHNPYHWNLDSIETSAGWPQYRDVVERIMDAIQFMESFGGVISDALGRVEFYTSHEGLLLGYEQALTRTDPASGRSFNLGTHMLWIGQRTRQLEGAHVEYFRGIANPIGLKIGPDTTPDEVAALIERLNPDNEEGRLTLITRIGAGRIEQVLPPLVERVAREGRSVVWSCDPMHANTTMLSNGFKTRDFSVVLSELSQAFTIHAQMGSHLGGVHFELTGDDVTECIGGAQELTGEDLNLRYETYCDPRLNASQSLEMAFLIAKLLKGGGGGQS